MRSTRAFAFGAALLALVPVQILCGQAGQQGLAGAGHDAAATRTHLEATPVQPSASQARTLGALFQNYVLYQLPIEDLHHAVEQGREGLSRFALTLPGTGRMNLELTENELRAPGYRADVRSKEGLRYALPSPCMTFKGQVSGGGWTRVSIHAGSFEGLFKMPGGRDLVLERLFRHDQQAPADLVVAYWVEDLRPDQHTGACAVADAPALHATGQQGHGKADGTSAESDGQRADAGGGKGPLEAFARTGESALPLECHDIEVATDADYSYWSRFGDQTFNEQLAELNLVEGIYVDQLGVTVSVTYQNAYADPVADPYEPWETVEGTTTGVAPFRLIDATADFSDLSATGLSVINFDTGKRGTATALPVPPYTTLQLDSNLFTAVGQDYRVHLNLEVLPQFRAYWQANNAWVMRDVALLYNDLGGGGQGYSSTICNLPGWAYAQRGYSSTLTGNILLSAHEVGHTLGAAHAETTTPGVVCDGTGPIMCSAVQSSSSLDFLPASVGAVRTHLLVNSSCTFSDYPYAQNMVLYTVPPGYSSLTATYSVNFDPISFSSISPAAVYKVEAGYSIRLEEDFVAPDGAHIQFRIVPDLEDCNSILDRVAENDGQPETAPMQTAAELHVQPNPANGPIRMGWRLPDAKTALLACYDPIGRLVWQRSLDTTGNAEQWEGWDVRGQAAGVYTLVLQDPAEPQKRIVERLVVLSD